MLVAAATVGFAAVLVLPTAADASPGTWGPDGTPYGNGIVCSGDGVETALVSWSSSGGTPAFAVSPVQSGRGRTDQPAVAGVAVPVQAGSDGLDSTSIATLAYLIARHGDDPDAGRVADVAADVLAGAGSSNIDVDNCLNRNIGGASQTVASSLLDAAGRLAGPYTVTVNGPSTPVHTGAATPVTAQVTSAAGYPVPDLDVSFSSSSANVSFSVPTMRTDATGQARTVATVTGVATGGPPVITAAVSGTTGLVETSGGGTVPLVAAAPARTFSGNAQLTVDAKPDPALTLRSGQSLLLNNGVAHPSLSVTGMNGHAGAAAVSLFGPLPVTQAGCGAHTAAEWAALRAAHTTASSTQVLVTDDGTYPVDDSTPLSPGCYQPYARLVTTDATPNVSAATTGDTIAVVPVTVSASPDHGGLAPIGALSTTLVAKGSFPGSWQDVRATVLGPRPATAGQCPSIGWETAKTVSTASSTDTAPGTAGAAGTTTPAGTTAPADGSTTSPTDTTGAITTTVNSGPVTASGCYGFRITGTLSLAGVGTTTVTLTPGDQSLPVHVIAPAVSVTGLSGSGVQTGDHLSARVTVSASEGQPGSLRLELLRLPYTWRGCFAADWTHAPVVVTTKPAPLLPTDGDRTYTVRTAAVPGLACWTVVPVFTASANPAIHAQTAAGADPMLAFTSVERVRSDRLASSNVGDEVPLVRPLVTLIALGLLVLVAMWGAAVAARRGRRHEVIDPADNLLN